METDPGSGIYVENIPKTNHFFRIWPANPQHHEVCFDYLVQDESGQRCPINRPDTYELWVVPDAKAAIWMASPGQLLPSLEQSMSELQPGPIQPGEEKWVLKDGVTCQIRTRLEDTDTDVGKCCIAVTFTVPKYSSAVDSEHAQYSGPQIQLPEFFDTSRMH